MSEEQHIQTDGEDGAVQAELSVIGPDESAVPSANGAGAVAHPDRPPALIGVSVPGRDRSIRRMVLELYRENPHLPSASRGIVSDYCKVVRAAERVYQRWQGKGFEPGRDADLFMKATSEARHHATVLGLTPVSMASLGVDLGRMRRLTDDGRDSPILESDLREMEARILARLHDAHGPTEDGDRPALAAEATPTGAGDETSRDASRDGRERDE